MLVCALVCPPPSGSIGLKHVWKHKEEVWSLAPSPVDAGLVFTGHHNLARHTASLWRMPGVVSGAEDAADEDASATPALVRAGAAPAPADMELVATLPDHASTVHTCVCLQA